MALRSGLDDPKNVPMAYVRNHDLNFELFRLWIPTSTTDIGGLRPLNTPLSVIPQTYGLAGYSFIIQFSQIYHLMKSLSVVLP